MNDDAKLIDISAVVLAGFWVFGLLLFVCELGERVSLHFDMFAEELEQCNWCELPIKMQRMYLIFLADTQQPVQIECYANVILTRQTFQAVCMIWAICSIAHLLGTKCGKLNWFIKIVIFEFLLLISDNRNWMEIFHDTSPTGSLGLLLPDISCFIM